MGDRVERLANQVSSCADSEYVEILSRHKLRLWRQLGNREKNTHVSILLSPKTVIMMAERKTGETT